MSGRVPQSFENHTRFVIPYHFVVLGILLINLVAAAKTLVAIHDFAHVLQTAVATALILGFLYARGFVLAVQDRVIRLEMRLRLAALAPGLMDRFEEFTAGQLVALRFAGDGELRSLAQQTLEGKFASTKVIKQQIRDWKADHWRA
jgi:hypothetical protein